MEMNELDVLSSIYGQELQILSPSLVKLFVSDDAFVMMDLSGYPESLPKIHVSDSHSRNSEENGRKAVDEVLRGYRKGDAILFDALEAARQAMMVIHDHHEEEEEGRGKAEESGGEQMNPKQMERAVSPVHNLQQQPSEIIIWHGEPFTDRKSTFQAHASPVNTMQGVLDVLNLLREERKFRIATHNVVAYQFRDENKRVDVRDYDDDGESAAGSRLLELLRLIWVAIGSGISVMRQDLYWKSMGLINVEKRRNNLHSLKTSSSVHIHQL
eukprot:1809_1